MPPKTSAASKKQKAAGSTSRKLRQFDATQFVGDDHDERFRELEKRKIWTEKKFEINREGNFKEITRIIETKKWGELIDPPSYLNYDVVRELYENALPYEEKPFTFTTMVRGRNLI